MRALLNSLGLTLWSSIAIVLAVGLALVGYRVSLSMKDSPPTIGHPAAGVAPAPPFPFPSVQPSFGSATPAAHGQRYSRVIEPEMRRAQAALQAGQWQEVLDDAQAAERKQGITVFDAKTINHFKAYAHLRLHNYGAALTEFERVLAAGIATPEETASISKTVTALRAQLESERDALPQQETESNERIGAGTDVRPGQLYSAGDYQKAVDAITRGLAKGSIVHLDEAYVYLGLAQQKLGNIAEARRAFARLQDVPNVSPKILRLWTLYADTLAGQAETAEVRPASQEPAVPALTSTPVSAPTPTLVWTEGRNYRLVPHPVPTSLPGGKVLVTELFSYACPSCNQFQAHMQGMINRLPQNAVVSYVPVSFQREGAWPMFQRAYVTAQGLGVADKTHDAMFEAVWSSGELAPTDAQTGAPRSPTIEDAAEFYRKRTGVSVATFLQASRSFTVETQVHYDEDLITAYGIDRIPAIVVDGKYVADVQSAGGAQQLIDLVTWLVAKETPTPEQASLRQPQRIAQE
jgi:protein dithiol oxidoreductase (disulfide-forming)